MNIRNCLFVLSLLSVCLFSSCDKEESKDSSNTSIVSNKVSIEKLWNINKFSGNYLLKLNSGENRKILLDQEGILISETIEYLNTTISTRDSLKITQDTTIVWPGRIVEAYYEIKEDSTFNYVCEYSLDLSDSEFYPNGTLDSLRPFFPPYPNHSFTFTKNTTRNYRDVYRGTWSYANKYQDNELLTRILFEIEEEYHLKNLAETFICDATDNGGNWNLGDPTDTVFSQQQLESVNHKYANGEKCKIWILESIGDKNMTIYREIDHIYTQANSSIAGYKITKAGNETIELTIE